MRTKKLFARFALLLTFSHFASGLAAAPFRMVVLGDSIMWGQGLLDADKIHNRVRDMLQSQLGYSPFSPESRAHSGATIGVDDTNLGTPLPGEIPTKYPTVLKQCGDFNNSPETVDLVLLNGGANDVNGGSGLPPNLDIVDPLVPLGDILTGTEQHCHRDMATLLEQVSAKFTRATIVVSGYFPIVSAETPIGNLLGILSNLGITAPDVSIPVRDAMVDKSRRWAEESANKLSLAVDEANVMNRALGRCVRIVFADPRFGPSNAMLASRSWLFTWKLDIFPPFLFVPEDPMRFPRVADCIANLKPPTCEWASMGHPNPSGAQAYANAIVSAYLNARGTWVSFNPSCTSCGDGTAANPYGSLAAGRDSVPNGGTIFIKSGTTTERITINKSCWLQACGGPVTIGR